MSKYLRPAVAMGPCQPGNMGFYGPNSISRARNTEFFAYTRTKWIRIWVSWQFLFPYSQMVDPSGAPPFPDPNIFEFGEDANYNETTARDPIWWNMSPQLYLAQLDDQIIQARRAGLNITLTIWETPRWANRQRRKGWGIAFNDFSSANNARLVPPDEAKFRDSSWRLTLDSNAGRLLRFLCSRYSIYSPMPNGAPRNVDWIEVCNEANTQWTPSNGVFPEVAAWWMKLGWKAAKDWGGGAPTIFGPALSDRELPSSPTSLQLQKSYWRFTKSMFTHLRNGELIYDVPGGPPTRAFDESDGKAGWSHHNYIDVEYGRVGVYDPPTPSPSTNLPDPTMTASPSAHNSARAVRVWLKYNWRGWPNTASPPTQEPYLVLTEGGARVPVVGGDLAQRDRVREMWYRTYNGYAWSMRDTTNPDGPLSTNIGMFTNYLFWSSATYDSGMCQVINWSPPPEDRWLPTTNIGRPLFTDWAQFYTQAPRGSKTFWGFNSLGGWAMFSPEIITRYNGHLEVFVVGGDAHIWHKWWFNGTGWSGWEDLGGGCTSSVGACAPTTNTQSVFARAGDNNIWEGFFNGSYWELYHYRGSPPGGAASGPDANSVRHDGHKEIFVKGNDGALWHSWYFNGNWAGWESLGGDVRSDPTTVAWGNPDRVYAFYKTSPDGAGDRIGWKGYDAGVGWRDLGVVRGPKVRPDGQRVVKGLDVASQARDQMDLFVLGGDDCFWRLHYENGAWAEEWQWIGAVQGNTQNYQMISEPSATSWGVDRLDIVGISWDHQTYHNGYAPGG